MRDYGVVERRKVVIEMSTNYTPPSGEGQLAAAPRLEGRKFDEAVEKAVRKMLERGNRS